MTPRGEGEGVRYAIQLRPHPATLDANAEGVEFVHAQMGAAAGQPGAWRDGAWEWTVTTGSRYSRWYSLDGGWGGTTLGCCILLATPADVVRLALHERRHVAQNLVLGPLFLPLYVLLWLAFGYDRHPLERDARAAAGDRR